MLIVQYTKPEMSFTDVKIVFPPEFKTGRLDAAPSPLSAGVASPDARSSPSTCWPDWSSASSTA